MEDSEIVALFFLRDEAAIHQIEIKFGEKLRSLAMKLLNSREDVEECLNDTYMGAWNGIPPERPQYLFAYLAKICRFSAYGKLDWKNAGKRQAQVIALSSELENCISAPNEEEVSEMEIGRLLNLFLSRLSYNKRLIFMRRYWYEDSISDIAKRYHLSQSKVKVTLFRTRKALRKALEKEGYKV